jgi:hypothetical protein
LSVKINEDLLAKDPESSSLTSGLASIYARLGALQQRNGAFAAALDGYRRAYGLRQQQARNDPSNFTRQRSLAFAAFSLAEVLSNQKDGLDEAARLLPTDSRDFTRRTAAR